MARHEVTFPVTDPAEILKLRAGDEVVLFGPGDIKDAHRANEHVPIAEMERAGTVLDELIHRRCLA